MRDSTLAISLAGLSFLLTVIWGGPLLRVLRHFKIGKIIRVEEPTQHLVKMGTPTMGGVMVVLPVLLLTILLNAVELIGLRLAGQSVLVPMATLVAFALLGAIDDWEGVRGKRRGDGLSIRVKFVAQWVLAAIVAWALKYLLGVPDVLFPGMKLVINLGWLYVPIATFIIVAMSNAINFTDGLDGLGGLISATIFAAYGAIAILQGQIFLAQFSFTVVGALFGFLWFNVHPAQLMMGDTGSLAFGATIAVVALMTGQWVLLPLIAIIPVSEALSVSIQILYFKATKGRRFFKMAPIHLHFELLGWSETQIVQRFWLIGLLAALIGVGLALA
ncbi:MAG: phospho-N-acetylmuramoyl-pentapeptide-transferase [Anaerolineales bacterium]|jgi:phospho-N-acetylmuramoyl-pentapeptide-transferase|nr:phospho-N-acetylmuramoyl-pentapeptide-transferase [Anaerolineales bacterium]